MSVQSSDRFFDIHGAHLQFCTDSDAIGSAVGTLLRHFQRDGTEAHADLELSFRAVDSRSEVPVAIDPAAPVLFAHTGRAAGDRLRDRWQCTIYREAHGRIVDFHEQGLLRIDDRDGRGEGYLANPEAMHADVRISFLHFAVTELLKLCGLYTLHATALEKDGRGVLIPGASGRGKTTSCISLLRDGYRLLSDDHPLVRENRQDLQILSFPVKIDVTDGTVGFFPELRDAQKSLHPGVRKRFFYVEELYPHGTADRCEPAVILCPQVVDWPTSHVEPISRSRVLEELLKEGLLAFDREVAARQFQVFSRLVAKAACYRLFFGEDVLGLPRLIDPLLKQEAGE
jgi:hypothetical protein